jgi:colanic acid/amylovoran biosynthesis protein
MNILIPNATGINNIGDEAILQGLLGMVKNILPNAQITVHTYDPIGYKNSFASKIDYTLYSWAVFDDKNPVVRVWRLLQLFVVTTVVYFGTPFFRANKFYQLLQDYKAADFVVFSGGGYFVTKKGITQTLNLIMQLVMFWCAWLFNKKMVVAPISFGPFAKNWHRTLVAKTLDLCQSIYVRERYSMTELKKYNVTTHLLPDAAFLLPKYEKIRAVSSDKVIGYTVIDYFKAKNQNDFLQKFTESLAQFAKEKSYIIQPVIHVLAEKYGISDVPTTNKVTQQLQAQGVQVRQPITLRAIDQVGQLYAGFDLFLGMRMHSDIMAAIQEVPFIAIAYEHKTEGVCDYMGLSKLCIKAPDVDKETLYKLLIELDNNQEQTREGLRSFKKTADSVWRSEFSKELLSHGN